MARSKKVKSAKGGYATIEGVLEIVDGMIFVQKVDSDRVDLSDYIQEFDGKVVNISVTHDIEV